MYCKDCKFLIKKYCTSEKISNNCFENDNVDSLIYGSINVFNDGNGFKPGLFFGCVHFQSKRNKKIMGINNALLIINNVASVDGAPQYLKDAAKTISEYINNSNK